MNTSAELYANAAQAGPKSRDTLARHRRRCKPLLTGGHYQVSVPVMDRISDHTLSPAAAAKRAGCGRTSIMRALDSKALKGTRDNLNRWKITPEDLDLWAKDRPGHDRTHAVTVSDTDRDSDQVKPDDRLRALADLAAAEARLEELRTIIDRDDERYEATIQRHEIEIDRLESRHAAEIGRLNDRIDQLMTPRPTLLERISDTFGKRLRGRSS